MKMRDKPTLFFLQKDSYSPYIKNGKEDIIDKKSKHKFFGYIAVGKAIREYKNAV